MQQDIVYEDVVDDLKGFFEKRIAQAERAGVHEIMIDPGIGFGKTAEHNLEILRRLGRIQDPRAPVVGRSISQIVYRQYHRAAGRRPC